MQDYYQKSLSLVEELAADGKIDAAVARRITNFLLLNKEEEVALELFSILFKRDHNKVLELFEQQLQFSTGGIRQIYGPGSNRINCVNVVKFASAFFSYLRGKFCGLQNRNISILISYDGRKHARKLAQTAAAHLVAVSTVYVVQHLPTPLFSFFVRNLKMSGGIMFTASHNTKNYEGMKMYNEYGAQIMSPDDSVIADFYEDFDCQENKKENYLVFDEAFKELVDAKKVQLLSSSKLIESFADFLSQKYIVSFGLREKRENCVKFVYTPLNGIAGASFDLLVKKFKLNGYYAVVKSQFEINCQFPNITAPNPEITSVFAEAVELAKKLDYDLVLANDGDGDRLGVLERVNEQILFSTSNERIALANETITSNSINYNQMFFKNFRVFSGNEIGILLFDQVLYLCESQQNLNGAKFCSMSTLISTSMVRRMAEATQTKSTKFTHLTCPNGFKHISDYILKNSLFVNDKICNDFFFAFEESMGYIVLNGNHFEKDGLFSGILMLTLVDRVYNQLKTTLNNHLQNIYKKYGRIINHVQYVDITNISQQKIEQFFNLLDGLVDQQQLFEQHFKQQTYKITGYICLVNKEKIKINENSLLQPSKDIFHFKTSKSSKHVSFELNHRNVLHIRNSGTEPKIKIYIESDCDDETDAKTILNLARAFIISFFF